MARELFRQADRPPKKVRLVGVTLSALDRSASGQAELFATESDVDTRVARAVDRLAERFGAGTVTRAALLEDGTGSGDTASRRGAVRVSRAAPDVDDTKGG